MVTYAGPHPEAAGQALPDGDLSDGDSDIMYQPGTTLAVNPVPNADIWASLAPRPIGNGAAKKTRNFVVFSFPRARSALYPCDTNAILGRA